MSKLKGVKWGGNYNCIYCPKYRLENRHRCELYKKNLGIGRGPGLWILPCTECHRNKTYGGVTITVFENGATQAKTLISVRAQKAHIVKQLPVRKAAA